MGTVSLSQLDEMCIGEEISSINMAMSTVGKLIIADSRYDVLLFSRLSELP